MANSFVFSKIYPSNSIINPDVDPSEYLDSRSPFSFFDFLKYTKESLDTAQYNDLYINYIKQWNQKKNNTIDVNDTIRNRYVDLLKEITLKYSTIDERRFLSNIDFNDPSELDIIIPFYSKKINEVCNFYRDKREKLKFKIEKNKIKGTSTSLDKALYETITDIVFSDVLEIGLRQKAVDYDSLLKNLSIETEELYDLYTNYLDNDPDESYETYDVKTELRKELYSSNINKIYANVFLNIDSAIAEQIFEDVKIFLRTNSSNLQEADEDKAIFPFSINYNIGEVNLNCKPDDKLFNLVNSTKPKASRLVELKKSLITKYIGSDFYYITTGSTLTDVTSGVLFKAENPSGNLLNRHFPTTATVEEESELHSCRRIGLFFTPEKNSILYFSTPDKRYKIDETKLEPNKLYIFPDPEMYGNTFGLTKTYNKEYPLIHIADYTKSVKNYSNYYVEGDIRSSAETQDFYSYFSKSQTSDKKNGKNVLSTNFSSVYNQGIITQWSTDIYGNQFGLFKEKNKKNLVDNTITIDLSANICESYDGGPITFFQNGLLPEVVLASNPYWVKPNIWASNYYYNLLIEGGVGGFWNGMMERGIYWEGYAIDGLIIDRNELTEPFDISLNQLVNGTLVNVDGLNYSVPLSIDWNLNYDEGMNNPATYNIDGKFYVRHPKNINPRPFNTLDGNRSSNISQYQPEFSNNYILSSIKYKEFDAGNFSDECDDVFNFETQTNHIIKQIHNLSVTLTSNRDTGTELTTLDLKDNYGEIKVKDILTGNVISLSSSLSDQLESKYSLFVNEIYSKVLDFNIYNDFIWFRTSNHIVFEKLYYNNGKYEYSGTTENYIKYTNATNTTNASNPFIFENRDYCMFAQLSVINEKSNNFYIKPIFYKVDYKNCSITEIQNSEPLSSYKNDAVINPIKIRKVNKPFLIYNTRNRKYCLIVTVEDTNEMSYIYKILFDYDESSISNQEIKFYAYIGGQIIETLNFYDNPSVNGLFSNNLVNFNFNQSSGELILN